MPSKLTVSAVCLILLSSCTTVPVEMKFPAVPEELLRPCPQLEQAPLNDPLLSDLLTVVVDNYATYYECRARALGWIRWYNDQKRIFEEAFK